MRLLPLRNITGVVQSTDLQPTSSLTISPVWQFHYGLVRYNLGDHFHHLLSPSAHFGMGLSHTPTLSPHTHILNQVVDITLSWAPHHSLFSPLPGGGGGGSGAATAGGGYQWCCSEDSHAAYLLTSPRNRPPHTLQLGRDFCERHIQVETTVYRAKRASINDWPPPDWGGEPPPSLVCHNWDSLHRPDHVTTQGQTHCHHQHQQWAHNSVRHRAGPSPIAKHLTGPSSGTFLQMRERTSLNGWSVQSTDLFRAVVEANIDQPCWQSLPCDNFITAWSGTTLLTDFWWPLLLSPSALKLTLEWTYPIPIPPQHFHLTHTHTRPEHNRNLTVASSICWAEMSWTVA